MDEKIEVKKAQNVVVSLGYLLFSSGLLLNAVFVFGAYYYFGYVSTLGFDATLFPISRFDAYDWAYSASVLSGTQLIPLIASYLMPLAVLLGLAVFCFVLLWKKSGFSNGSTQTKPDLNKPPKFAAWLREKHPKTYLRIKRFVHSERVEEAGRVSARMLFVLWFLALCTVVWTMFPWLGYNLGNKFGTNRLAYFESSLCADSNNSWNWCSLYEYEGEPLEGRLLLKNGDLLGVYTSQGPLTVTAPDEYRFLRSRLPDEAE